MRKIKTLSIGVIMNITVVVNSNIDFINVIRVNPVFLFEVDIILYDNMFLVNPSLILNVYMVFLKMIYFLVMLNLKDYHYIFACKKLFYLLKKQLSKTEKINF